MCSPGFGTETARCRLWPVLPAAQAGDRKERSATTGADAAWKNSLPALGHLERRGAGADTQDAGQTWDSPNEARRASCKPRWTKGTLCDGQEPQLEGRTAWLGPMLCASKQMT